MKRLDLQRAIEPLAKKLAADLTAIISAHVGERFDGIRAAARGFALQELDAMFAGEVAAVELEPDEIAEPDSRTIAYRDPSPAKAIRKCRACRQPGHRADRCPDSEQPAPIVNAASIAMNKPTAKTPSPPPIRSGRFAAIEAAAERRRRENERAASGLDD